MVNDVKQVSGPRWHKFTQLGERVVGVYQGWVREASLRYPGKSLILHKVLTPSGGVITLLGHAGLNAQLADKSVGSEIIVTWQGLSTAVLDGGGTVSRHLYDVNILKAPPEAQK